MMRWFRSNIRSGAWCALVAFALQFALTFTHVHVPGAGAASAVAAMSVVADRAATADATPALPDAQPAKPQKPRPHGLADDFCAICSLIQLVASSVTASSPSLMIPVAATPVRIAIGIDRAPAASQPRHFQARAPPIA